MGGINKVLAQDWAMGVNDFTLKEGIILNPNYFPENGEDEYWQGDLKLTYKIENNSMKNYLKLNGFLRPTSGEFVTREFKVTGDETYNVEKAGDILYVARSLSCPVQEVVSDSEFKVTASVADVLTRYDSRFTSNALGNELICRVTSSGDVYYKAFSITDENVSLRDIKDWETGETGSAFEIATLAVGDLFELINAYDVLQEGLELTTGYPTLGYVIKHVESSGSWIKFNKYDKPNKSAIDKVLITYYPLSDFQPEYPYWSYMDRYGTYDVEENIDFPITTAQEEEIIQNFKKYLEPLITFTLVTKRPTILRRGQEIAFSASRYPTGIFKVIDNVINRETEKGSNNNRGNVIQKITFANYTDNWARMIGNLKNRNDIQKAKIAEYKKQKSFFLFKLKVTWGNLSRDLLPTLDPPENLGVNNITSNSFDLTWDSVIDADSYRLYISDDNGISFIAGYSGKTILTTNESVTGLNSGVNYTIWVASYNENGIGDLSEPIEIETIDLITSLIAHYDFNGSVTDISGNGNNATLQGSANVSGNYLTIGNNATDYLRIPHTVLSGLSTYSVSAWLKIDTMHTTDINTWLIGARSGQSDAFAIKYEYGISRWQITLNYTNYSFAINTAVNDLQKHFYTLTVSGTNAKLYIDSVLVSSITIPATTLSLGSNGFVLGQEADSYSSGASGFSATQSLAGKCDELRFYSVELDQDKINEIYRLGSDL